MTENSIYPFSYYFALVDNNISVNPGEDVRDLVTVYGNDRYTYLPCII